MLDAQQRAMMHLAPAALGQADVAANPACAGMWSQAGAGGRDLYQPTFRGVLSMRFA